MATPREGQAALQGNAKAPDTAVGNWTEERMLEPATSLLAMRTSRHQPRCLRQRTCAILQKLLQHHTNCHHQWVKRRDSESLKAEPAAATWAWLGPTLLVRAYDGGEHAVDDGLTPGQRRKVSVESAGKRAALAETGAWTELLRLFVRDMLAREVDVRGGTRHSHLAAEYNTEGGRTPVTSARLYRFSRQIFEHRRTYKLLLRFTAWLLLTQTNGRLRGSTCNVQRSNKLL